MESIVGPSKPQISSDWRFPEKVLVLLHSYGYDCLKRSNLLCLENNVLAFVAGCYVEVVNIETGEVRFIRSTSSGSIGSIAVHPSRQFLAVAEKGITPNIVIYKYSSLMASYVLHGGTEKSYSHVAFSNNGKLLASVGEDPDYTLTIWDWCAQSILLRSKAHSQEIFRVSFSPLHDGVITSVGTGHIKFWKMSSTFTGLKLQGKVGKFEKKEISDIEGYAELPDGKVLTGCEWGNLLLWEGGLIKVELSRKNSRSCHAGAIQQIIYQDDKILTMGLDGYVRAWDFEYIDSADTSNDNDLAEIEPTNELLVGEGVQLKFATRVPFINKEDTNDHNIWYAQDAAGAIWKLDLSFSEPMIPPECLFTFHSGPVTSLCSSPSSRHTLIASTGIDGTVRIYDYYKEQMCCVSRFNQPGTSLLWMPKEVDESCSLLVAGFEDGVIRLLNLKSIEHFNCPSMRGNSEPQNHLLQCQSLGDNAKLVLLQAAKPHKDRIVSIDVNPNGTIIATGSQDGTIFFFAIKGSTNDKPMFLQPFGFVEVSSAVTFIKWSSKTHNHCTLLVCCELGQVFRIEQPSQLQLCSTNTYKLNFLGVQRITIKTDDEVRENAGSKEIQDEQEISKRDNEVQRKPKKLGSDRPPVMSGFHSNQEGCVWVAMAGHNSGHLNEISFSDERNEKFPNKSLNVSLPSDDKRAFIKCMLTDEKNHCVVFGRSDGVIGFQPFDPSTKAPSSSYWYLAIHDSTFGQINSISISCDQKYIFTAGMDGNIFKFQYNFGDMRASMDEGQEKPPHERLNNNLFSSKC